jgi:hypothetical protein
MVVLPTGEVVKLEANDDMDSWTLTAACRKLGERINELLVDAGYFRGGVRE